MDPDARFYCTNAKIGTPKASPKKKTLRWDNGASLLLISPERLWSTHRDGIANFHDSAREHDPTGGGPGLSGENADLAKHLTRLPANGTVAIHDQEVTRGDLMIAAEIDLHQIPFGQRQIPFIGVDDVPGGLPAVRIAECRKIGDS